MSNKKLTEMVFILDRSGSMHGLEKETIGGYNSLIEKQIKEEGEAKITTVIFDDACEMLYDGADIKKVDEMTDKVYFARGCTALLDAIGKTIIHVGNRHKMACDDELPNKTIVTIITDGYENSSREFDIHKVKQLISEQKEEHGWEFMFLGANIDAIATARNFGINADRAVTYEADSIGTKMNFDAVCDATVKMRKNEPVDDSWKKEIENYVKNKK